MYVKKFNNSGCFDLTAYEAINNVLREERLEGVGERCYRPLVFICSPYAGNIEQNITRAQRYCRFAVSRNTIPLAPHLFFPQFMDDDDKEERSLALFMGIVLLGKCSEIWVFGRTSPGMTLEIERARSKGMKIRYFNERCAEVTACVN